jgi:hypothetical protein
MRHSDYRTTLRHYTVLGLSDTAGAVARLPDIGHEDTAERATGTAGRESDPQRYCQQLGRESERSGAAGRGESGPMRATGTYGKPSKNEGFSLQSAGKRATGIEPATFSLGS